MCFPSGDPWKDTQHTGRAGLRHSTLNRSLDISLADGFCDVSSLIGITNTNMSAHFIGSAGLITCIGRCLLSIFQKRL